VKTLGQGKQAGADSTTENWGSVKIVIFPPGTEKPADAPAPASSGASSDSDKQPLPATSPSPKR
jgi:hypothetical protein